MAIALAKTKKYDEAIEAADQALKLKPQEKIYQDLKNQIADYKQNEGLMKAQGVLEQGNKMFESGDFAGALKQYEEILPTIPEKNQPAIWFQIGRTQAKLKQPDKAIQAFKRAMELAPENADYRNALAQYYLDEKRYEEALELYCGSERRRVAISRTGALRHGGETLEPGELPGGAGRLREGA